MAKPTSKQEDQTPEATQIPETDQTAEGSGTTAQNTRRRPTEIGGPAGLEPTRYGDWERNGRCSDF